MVLRRPSLQVLFPRQCFPIDTQNAVKECHGLQNEEQHTETLFWVTGEKVSPCPHNPSGFSHHFTLSPLNLSQRLYFLNPPCPQDEVCLGPATQTFRSFFPLPSTFPQPPLFLSCLHLREKISDKWMEMFIIILHVPPTLFSFLQLHPPISLLPIWISSRENTTLLCHFKGFCAVWGLQAWRPWDGKNTQGRSMLDSSNRSGWHL